MYLGDTLFLEHLPVKIKENCLSLTFNSMMDHMLHGSFDVDPETVGQEGDVLPFFVSTQKESSRFSCLGVDGMTRVSGACPRDPCLAT